VRDDSLKRLCVIDRCGGVRFRLAFKPVELPMLEEIKKQAAKIIRGKSV
jgi:hypothetical protein